MIYSTGEYKIDLHSDPTYKKGCADNNSQYDFVYFDESVYQCPSVFGIKLFLNDVLVSSAVIGSVGGGTGVHSTSTIVESHRLLHCCSDSVFCLSIPELTLLWRTKADWATCFQIFTYKNDYIIHGEMEISRIDEQGKIVWQQGGADIFVCPDGREGFKITDKFIVATDFGYKEYKFDFDGHSIL